ETGLLIEGEWWDLYCSRRAVHAEMGQELETSSTDTMGRLLWELYRASRRVHAGSHGSVALLNEMRLNFKEFWSMTHSDDSFEPLCAGPRCAPEELGGAPTGPELLRWAIATFGWKPKFNWNSFTRGPLDPATAQQMMIAATLLEELGQDVVDDAPPSPRFEEILVHNVAVLESIEPRQRQQEEAAWKAELEWEKDVERAAARAAARARKVRQPVERRVTRSMAREEGMANRRMTRSIAAEQRAQQATASKVAEGRVSKSKATKGKATKGKATKGKATKGKAAKTKGKAASKTRGKGTSQTKGKGAKR
ncbi:hypothetical protein LTS18_009717, partial [Coniosporium uncinatum]